MYNATGIILAGGRSRRMGRDKAFLPLPGVGQTTFVEHLVSMLSSTCCELLLVARDAEQAAAYEHYLPSVHIVIDAVPDTGPLMGLYSGLHAMHSSHALVTAVDTPFLQADLLSFLLSHPLDDALLVPIVESIPQVLLAVYPYTVLSVVEERLREGRRDPRSLLQVVDVHYIEEAQLREVDPQLRSFISVNTPEELAML